MSDAFKALNDAVQAAQEKAKIERANEDAKQRERYLRDRVKTEHALRYLGVNTSDLMPRARGWVDIDGVAFKMWGSYPQRQNGSTDHRVINVRPSNAPWDDENGYDDSTTRVSVWKGIPWPQDGAEVTGCEAAEESLRARLGAVVQSITARLNEPKPTPEPEPTPTPYRGALDPETLAKLGDRVFEVDNPAYADMVAAAALLEIAYQLQQINKTGIYVVQG